MRFLLLDANKASLLISNRSTGFRAGFAGSSERQLGERQVRQGKRYFWVSMEAQWWWGWPVALAAIIVAMVATLTTALLAPTGSRQTVIGFAASTDSSCSAPSCAIPFDFLCSPRWVAMCAVRSAHNSNSTNYCLLYTRYWGGAGQSGGY